VGERGPKKNGFGEVSIKAIRNTGHWSWSDGNTAPDDKYQIILYKNKKYGFDWNNNALTVSYSWQEHIYWESRE
jgi:hypothetical protein